MDLRSRLSDGVKDAMKAKDSQRLSTLRLINAALKEKDIVARSEGRGDQVGEDEILSLLGKMVKQRQESARVYEEGGRIELAEQELQEIGIIEDYLPRQLDEAETEAAISEAIEEVGAESLRDMGPVMGALKSKFTGRMDFGKVGPLVKAKLG
ncbi:MAG: GatB/YqeY domain-containing protein [Pseudomonadota bacterium]